MDFDALEQPQMLKDVGRALENASYDVVVYDRVATSRLDTPPQSVSEHFSYGRREYKREEWNVEFSSLLTHAEHHLQKKVGKQDGPVYVGESKAVVGYDNTSDSVRIALYRRVEPVEVEEAEDGNITFTLPHAVREKFDVDINRISTGGDSYE